MGGNYSSVSVIIPCLDEAAAIGPCVAAVLAQGVGEVIVVDGGSRDATVARAQAAAARVVVERQRGYGRALMTGVDAARGEVDVDLEVVGLAAVLVHCRQRQAVYVRHDQH